MTIVTPDAVGRVREFITPLLQRFVDRLDAGSRLPVAYHFGWCDERGRSVNANGGKGIRPALALLGAAACGVDFEMALPAAAAVELIHNFSLVHDDLMDRSRQRRHRATVWALWGDATAVLAGDAMLSLAHEALLDCPSAHRAAVQSTIAIAVRHLIRGQTADVAFESRDDVSFVECVNMSWAKTAALMAASGRAGTQLAGAPRLTQDALDTYGGQLGLAFQLIDDLLGIWGQPTITGKPVYSDLRSRKKTLPVTWTVQNGGMPGRELAAWLSRSAHSAAATDDELHDVAALIERGGGREWAREEANRRAGLAIEAIARTAIPQGPADQLRALAIDLTGREA